MKIWLRRIGALLFVTFWLAVMAFPVVAFALATQEQISIGSADGRHLRLFLLQEDDASGVGFEWSRRAGPDCLQTSIGYLLWEGDETDPGTSYCQCIDPQSNILQPQPLSACR